MTRISDEVKDLIRRDYATGKYSYAALSAKYGVAGTSIGRIVNPDYQEREREKNRIRQRTYEQPKPAYTMNVRFYHGEDTLIDKIKSVDNIQQYIKNLIANDIEKDNG